MKFFYSTLGITLVAFSLTSCNPFETSWVDDCEIAFKERLRSPATYKRIDSSVISTDITLEEYIALNPQLMPAQIMDLKERNPPIKKWYALVTYDADNAVGVPIRGKFQCDAVNTDGSEPKGGRSAGEILIMKVDGKSNMELQTEGIRP